MTGASTPGAGTLVNADVPVLSPTSTGGSAGSGTLVDADVPVLSSSGLRS